MTEARAAYRCHGGEVTWRNVRTIGLFILAGTVGGILLFAVLLASFGIAALLQ